MKKVRTLLEINKKINKNKAIVFTVQELIDRINDGEKVQFKDVDVITTATKGLMSGIIGIFSFRLAPTKQVRKFVEISLNGINSIPGPCPNEFLGIVDLIVYGTALSSTIKDYSGGTLFRDLVEGKVIEVVGNSEEGEKVEKKITLEEMQFARMIGTRQAIKNYFAMVNPGTEEIKTIFSVLPLKGNFSQLTFSGCGAMNPFQNDPKAKVFGVGTPVLVNGNKGFIIGP
ncbi:MAG TPA: homocysteine biosynthesis protein, partial [Candidatus Lokiarchaeia archaeon]